MTGEARRYVRSLGDGLVGLPPAPRSGLRKNSAGSTSRMVADLPMISGPTQVTARSTRLK